jgi:hypothetical protein
MNDNLKKGKKVEKKIDKEILYGNLVHYEVELFKNRWTVFTALMSISFIVLGLGLKEFANEKNNLFLIITCGLAFFIYLIAFAHYLYFHRLAHAIRDSGEKLEKGEKDAIFTIRREYREKRKIHFHAIIILFTIAYALILIVIIIFLK